MKEVFGRFNELDKRSDQRMMHFSLLNLFETPFVRGCRRFVVSISTFAHHFFFFSSMDPSARTSFDSLSSVDSIIPKLPLPPSISHHRPRQSLSSPPPPLSPRGYTHSRTPGSISKQGYFTYDDTVIPSPSKSIDDYGFPLDHKLKLSRFDVSLLHQALSRIEAKHPTPQDPPPAFSIVPPPTPPIPPEPQVPPFNNPYVNEMPHSPSLSLVLSMTPRTPTILMAILSILTGLCPTYQTFLLGDAFEAFNSYTTISISNPTPDQLKQAQHDLVHKVLIVAIQLLALAAVTLTLSIISVGGWTVLGERATKQLRKMVWEGIGQRELAWFDLGMGSSNEEGGESEGVAGLMGRFARETDDYRIAITSNMSLLFQYASTCISCLIVAFIKSYQLTFVILASVPLIMIVTIITERFASSLFRKERDYTALCTTKVERTITNITTVKAFNAQRIEADSITTCFSQAERAYSKLVFCWGVRLSFVQFILLSMFVQGFWFGSYLVQKGTLSTGGVMQVFWACLLASSHLQMCNPLFNILHKGKAAIANLMDLSKPTKGDGQLVLSSVGDEGVVVRRKVEKKGKRERADTIDTLVANHSENVYGEEYGLHELHTPTVPTFIPITPLSHKKSFSSISDTSKLPRYNKKAPRNLRRIQLANFSGSLGLKNVSFRYPSLPPTNPPNLRNVTMWFTAQETTFIVGSSGSGKSTIASLLLGWYKPSIGYVEVDDSQADFIDASWLASHVCCVSQDSAFLIEGTVHDNIAIGVAGGRDGRLPKDVTRDQVVEAATSAMVHEFVRDMPEGYDTLLSGEKGAGLSGGQRQRLALARALIRKEKILILGMYLLALFSHNTDFL
jgi:ATP-binding cassette, subfamily B (MDR/TAP), member 1